MHPFQSILVHWFLKCRCSLLPSPVWPLPICLDSWTPHPGSYAILLFTASDLASITNHIYNRTFFLLWLRLFILSEVSSPLISSRAPTDLGSSSFRVLSFCLFILFMRFSRQEHGSSFPFPSPVDHIWQNSPAWPIHLGWPYMARLIVPWVKQSCSPCD